MLVRAEVVEAIVLDLEVLPRGIRFFDARSDDEAGDAAYVNRERDGEVEGIVHGFYRERVYDKCLIYCQHRLKTFFLRHTFAGSLDFERCEQVRHLHHP